MRRRIDLKGRSARFRGFILVDVMTAVLLVGILVGPLVAGALSSWESAASLRDKAVGLRGLQEDSLALTSWEWGPMVCGANWEQGPSLSVKVRGEQDAGTLVGIWADGWPVGEWEADEAGRLVVGKEHWKDSAGKELTLRVRPGEGAWGPPWRCIVPDAIGSFGPEATASPETGQVVEDGHTWSVCHVPSASRPNIRASWAPTAVVATVQDAVFLLIGSTSGVSHLTLEGQRQTWLSRDRRWLDVYF